MTTWQRWTGIMKAVPFEEKRLLKWQPPFIVQPKYDGIRCRAIPLDNGEWLLLSSEENPLFSTPHINDTLRDFPKWELDGELYAHGMTFEQITSITSRTVNIHSDHQEIGLHLFDVIDNGNQLERLKRLLTIQESKHITIAPFWICNNLEDIMRAYDKMLNAGYEGIIVRHHLAPYERKRSTLVMKFKAKKEDTYEIIGAVEEVSKDGVPKNSLGALICRGSEGSEFSVGTGFTKDTRASLWQRVETLKGQYARVQYQHLTSKQGVPRFPVFVEIINPNERS